MRSFNVIKPLVIFILLTQLTFAEDIEKNATATLPLDDVIDLYLEKNSSKIDKEVIPPIPSIINTIDLKGQLLENIIDITADIKIEVLQSKKWTTVPIFKVDNSINITSIPEIDNAVPSISDGYFSLITEKPGSYSFTISFIKKVNKQNNNYSASLQFSKATKADLHLQFNENLFTILNKTLIKKSDGVILYPQNSTFDIKWKQNSGFQPIANKVVKRPPIESMIKSAHASTISTIEGELITRVTYALQFEGSKSIEFTKPKDHKIKKVYINSSSIPFTINNDILKIEVQPKRVGDQSGKVELVLSKQQDSYNLSGTIDFPIPKASWPIHEMFFDLYMPTVFNYSYVNGSLEQINSSPDIEYTYSVPTPGKKLSFHQYLISTSNPSLTLSYTIDLTGKYFISD